MKTLLRRFAAALSLASLALSWPLAFVSAQTQTARRILIIGDSQSVNLMSSGGLGQKLSASGITVVGRYTKVCWGVESMLTGVPTVANANCNTGGPVSDFLSQNSGTYDAVVVFLGGNDCASTRPCAANYGSKIDQLIALLQPKSTNIIWFGPTYYESPDKHVQSRTFMNSYMPSRVTHYYDLWDLTTSITKPPGDVHFDRRDPGGYPRFGELVAPIIASFINGTPVAPVTSASTDSGTPPPTADVLGRSPEEVQAQLAAQCADRDPVFPVRLGVGIGGTTEVNGLTEYINVVYRYMTAIVLVVAIVMVTYGGFRYLLAASPIGVKDGKDVIKNAIVGMVLVLGAYVILNTINPATTVLQFTEPLENIACVGFVPSIGQLRPGLSETARQELRDAPVGSVISYWDPLLLRARPMISCNSGGTPTGTSDMDAVRAIFSNVVSGSCPASQVCVEADEYAEAISNTDLPDYNEGLQNFCSNGGLYSVCSAAEHCDESAGLVCLGHSYAAWDEWQACVIESGNEEVSPCGRGIRTSSGPGGVMPVDAGCASGLECVERQYNYPNDAEDVPNALVINRDLKVCAKSVPTATLADIRTINGSTEVIPSSICKYHRDCRDEGTRCVSDDVLDNKRVCAPRNATDGAVCGLVREGNATQTFFPCTGSDGFTCVFCPDETNAVRNWTPLNGSNRLFDIGQCKHSAAVRDGLRCAGS